MAQEQNFKNHTRFDPMYHGFLFFVWLFLFVVSIYELVHAFSWIGVVRLIGVIWLVVLLLKVRLYALKVQDRVIRLEERLRLEKLLPDGLRGRIEQLSVPQLIALRFASDGEIPALVQKTLDGNLDAKTIKQSIQIWRPDFLRV